MRKISNITKLKVLSAICLWIIGSFLLWPEKNGSAIVVVITIIITAGLYRQIKKYNPGIKQDHHI